MLALFHVESLFSNVPIEDTLNIIIKNVYNHPNLSPPPLSQDVFENLLVICTTKTPFRAPGKTLYQQIDGVSMGTPL